MPRRPAYLVLCFLLLLSSTGCSSKKTTENQSPPGVTQPPTAITQTPADQESPSSVPNAVQSDTDQLESFSLDENFRFVVIADSRGSDHGVNTEIVRKVLSEIQKLSPQPEFAIMPGDLTEGSKQYKEVKKQLEYFKQVITEYYPISFYYPGIGNHEMKAGAKGEKAYAEVFSEFSANFLKGYHKTSYYIDTDDSRIFMLNSDHPEEMHKITGSQLAWLKANVDPNKKHNIFLLHEPAYPTGAEAGYSLDKYPGSRDSFWKVVDSLDHSIVFCGHEHNYSRRVVDSSFNETAGGKKYKFGRSIFQVISGGFGAPLYEKYTLNKNIIIPPQPQYHYTVVDIREDGLSVQAINLEGEILDSFLVQ